MGANQPDDAVYPLNIHDAAGNPLKGENHYVLHFSKEELLPMSAFWSLTMLYDANGFQVANPINRFAMGDRDALKFKPDGSLDLYIRHESPGAEKESNWLPSLQVNIRHHAAALRAQSCVALWTVDFPSGAASQRRDGNPSELVTNG